MSDPRPAAVSAPAGEATRTQFDYLLNAFEQASQHDAPATQGYAEKRRALFAYVRALESRSSSPASGAPDEHSLQLALESLEMAERDYHMVMVSPAEARALRTRLAASERAGVALREALRTYGDHKAYCESTYGPPGVGDCTCGLAAALTPTAPSPEERADGE